MSKSPWGKIGNWAAEAEREEAEERQAAAAAPAATFPALKDAVGKQKKKTKMTLQEFNMQQSSPVPARGLTREEMLRLPTGPKERTAEEMQYGRFGGGGGGFSNQGRGRDYEGRRSYGHDGEGRDGGRVEFDQPSRADGVDNWASMKRPQQTLPERNLGDARQGGRYSGGGDTGIASRADEVDNWAAMKKPVLQQQVRTGSSSFGTGLGRTDAERWTRNEPQRLVVDAPKFEPEGGVKVNRSNPFGAARPREEVLAEKGLDWKKLDLESDVSKQKQLVSGGSRPSSSQSSRPGTSQSSRSEVAPAALIPGADEGIVKQKPKVNPFGEAKPREVLLEEKGVDWKKIDLDLDHRRVERLETDEEKNLKEEIDHLKKEVLQKPSSEQASLNDLIGKKEHELELLIHEIDDKVRYTQKTFERPGSGSGRPPSRPGSHDGPRAGFHDRPSSRPGSHDGPHARFHDGSHPGSHDGPHARFHDGSHPGHHGRPHAGFHDRSGMFEDPKPEFPGAYVDHRGGFERPRSHSGAYNDRPSYHEGPRFRQGGYEESQGGFPQRPSFMPGGFQDPRDFNYNERNQGRGAVNSWSRPADDRRGTTQGGGGRGFPGNRDVNRSAARW